MGSPCPASGRYETAGLCPRTCMPPPRAASDRLWFPSTFPRVPATRDLLRLGPLPTPSPVAVLFGAAVRPLPPGRARRDRDRGGDRHVRRQTAPTDRAHRRLPAVGAARSAGVPRRPPPRPRGKP